jgi:hypothetical protein
MQGKFAAIFSEYLFSHFLSKNLKFKIYKTVILFVILYGYETWSHDLKEKHKLTVLDNEVLRRMCGLNERE